MKKILYLLFLIVTVSFSQEQASNWYFGENAGIQFDTLSGAITTLSDGQLNTDEGCTSISDQNGNLLFYTDGITVFDRIHNIMPNGNNLKGNPSSTQSAIIIPKPNDINIYYIFTVDTAFQGSIDEGFHYSEVDMTLNGGFGQVTATKNINLLNNTSEKLSAVVKDCESGNIWVITFADRNGGENNNTFYAYEVSDTGVNTTPVVSPAGININERRGYLKFSPDGTKLVCANISQGLFMFDFDPATGIVNNTQQINISFNSSSSKPQSSYGLEFSPNSQLLYVSSYFETPQADFNDPNAQYGALLQYSVNAPDISASEIVIDDRQMYRSALQLAPNGKIYRSLSQTYFIGTPFLSVIDVPNAVGLACNYQHAIVDLNGRNSRQGLPPFISSFFNEKIDITGNETESTYLPLCTGDIFTLFVEDITGATYTWYQDGVLLAEADNDLEISVDGTYELTIELNSSDCEILEGEAIVEYFDIPIASQPGDILICDDDNNDIWSFNFTSQDIDVIDSQDATIYSVHYFRSQEDADNNENEIIGQFDNTENPQTIFVRIHNDNNTNCYDSTTFEIEVFNTPTANLIDDFPTCDDDVDGDDTNGQINVLLTDFDNTVLDTQNAADYTITYHDSQVNANAGSPALPNTYYLQTPFLETIFVRIENNLNTTCYDTTSFDVIVNPLPNRIPSSIFQCDEDGDIDGETQFNLTEAVDDLTGSATNVSVKFYAFLIDAQNEENEIDGTNYPNTSNPQIVFAQIIDNATECSAIIDLTLEVSTTQIQDYTAPAACDELDSEDGINSFNLDDFTTEIQTLNGIALPITYFENYNDALLEQNPLTSPYTNTTSPYSHTIYARAEDNNACYGISEVMLTIDPRPQLIEAETVLYCLNTFPETIPLTSGVIGNPDDYTYTWSNGETTNEIQINLIGDYTVIVSNSFGCTKQRTITVEASNIATIDSVDVIDGSLNNVVTIQASGEGIYEYALFDFEGELYAPYQSSNVFNNVYPGIYTIEVKDIKNFCGIEFDLFSVIGFAQYFTPNNDGYNDTWQVLGVSSQFQPNTKIKIFDRYGKLLKQISPLSKGWDGTFNGNHLPNDDYWFSVKLQDGREYFNHFSLKR